jgi:hypothetical protein
VRRFILAAIGCLILQAVSWAGTTITPTTSLSIETTNNTSAASSFATQTNNNLGASNISKVATRTQIYTGSTSPLYAHFMAWFGGNNHMNVGYRSDDPTQVHKQIDDMLSRGLNGMIIDWYGPNGTRENNTSIYVMQDAASRGGQFVFAIMEDVGSLKACAATAGCNVTQQLISDLAYIYTQFESSPDYMRVNGRPVIAFFGVDVYTIDWPLVRSSVQGNPLFIFRNNGAFTHPETNGGFSWVGLSSTPTNMGLGYLDSYYKTALTYPAEYTFGSGYKGFNDTLASWGSNRILDQQCGQTWLATLAEAGKYYSAANQLDAIQLVTWNDYEEGTEIETGIDNCVSITAAMSGSKITWNVNGQPNTIDHYTIFISTDGQNLMSLAKVATSVTALDLSTFGLAPGKYVLYVKAVGKPSLLNHMSGAVSYSTVIKRRALPIDRVPTTGTSSTGVRVVDTHRSLVENGSGSPYRKRAAGKRRTAPAL